MRTKMKTYKQFLQEVWLNSKKHPETPGHDRIKADSDHAENESEHGYT